MGFARTLAAGALAGGLLPLAVATPASAAFVREDTDTRTVTFGFGGTARTCRLIATTRYEYPAAGVEGDALIRSSTSVADDPGCREPVYEVSLLGRYETAPDSGRFRTFFATSGVGESPRPGGVSVELTVPGPTGPLTVDHRVTVVCDGPSNPNLCSYTLQTSPK
ncbi:MAG TPA: hypothetical protein VE395_06860 [Acidimicrobiales bacterium]|nr:hypothetical protein [Acidimicrobiales bacterium]